MRMEEGLDTGPVYLVHRLPIAANETAGSLHDKLAELGAARHRRGAGGNRVRAPAAAVVQPAAAQTYAAKIAKEEAVIGLVADAASSSARFAPSIPFPARPPLLRGEALKIWRAQTSRRAAALPGTVLQAADRTASWSPAGADALSLEQFQRAGGKRMAAAEFLRGSRARGGRPARRLTRTAHVQTVQRIAATHGRRRPGGQEPDAGARMPPGANMPDLEPRRPRRRPGPQLRRPAPSRPPAGGAGDSSSAKPVAKAELQALLVVAVYQLEHSGRGALRDRRSRGGMRQRDCRPQRKPFVNAVLRNFQRNRAQLLESAPTPANAGRYSHPQWWIDRLRAQLPANTRRRCSPRAMAIRR